MPFLGLWNRPTRSASLSINLPLTLSFPQAEASPAQRILPYIRLGWVFHTCGLGLEKSRQRDSSRNQSVDSCIKERRVATVFEGNLQVYDNSFRVGGTILSIPSIPHLDRSYFSGYKFRRR